MTDSSLKIGTNEITTCLTSDVESRNWRVQSLQNQSTDWSLVWRKFDGKAEKQVCPSMTYPARATFVHPSDSLTKLLLQSLLRCSSHKTDCNVFSLLFFFPPLWNYCLMSCCSHWSIQHGFYLYWKTATKSCHDFGVTMNVLLITQGTMIKAGVIDWYIYREGD